jgi:hypothetical protein
MLHIVSKKNLGRELDKTLRSWCNLFSYYVSILPHVYKDWGLLNGTQNNFENMVL